MEQTQCQCQHSHSKKIIVLLFVAALIGLGSALGGWFMGNGFYKARFADRYVSVKGVAERQVKSDLAIWDLSYKATGNDLRVVNNQINQNQKDALAFLAKHNFVASDFELEPTTVIDQYAQEYSSGNKPESRYIITGGIKVRTDKVDLVREVSRLSSELIQEGIVVTTKDYQANPRYLFTKLEDVRPPMLAQATKSARAVAEQFAIDSNSHVGDIRRANQGMFQILNSDSSAGQNAASDNDQLSGIYKTVRVVSSIDYSLQN